MNREEAANVLWWASKQHYPGDQMDITECVIEAFDMAIAALNEVGSPTTQLDENGLMPCGCGGKAAPMKFNDGFADFERVWCIECKIEVTRVENGAKEAWNRAMGRASE